MVCNINSYSIFYRLGKPFHKNLRKGSVTCSVITTASNLLSLFPPPCMARSTLQHFSWFEGRADVFSFLATATFSASFLFPCAWGGERAELAGMN